MEGSLRQRPQHGNGRTRRRKRSGSRGLNDNQNRIKHNGNEPSSEFRFDVEIPNYYNDAIQNDITRGGTAEEGSLSAGCSEGVVHHAPNKEDDTPQKKSFADNEPNGKNEFVSSSEQDKRHNDFVAALEKYGSCVGAWVAMASDLKWTEEEVKVYAYSYFKTLVQDRNRKTRIECDDQMGMGQELPIPTTDCAWSFHELILLDSLMVKYCTDLSCLDVKQQSKTNDESSQFVRQTTAWEKIAAQFPGKNSETCKKMGISRLLSLYGERDKKGSCEK